MYPLLMNEDRPSSESHDGNLPFYYRKGNSSSGSHKRSKDSTALPQARDRHEIIKVSDTYFKFELMF